MSSTGAGFDIRKGEPGEGELILPCYEWLFTPPGGPPPEWRPSEALMRLEKTLASEEAALILAESPSKKEAGDAEPVGICSVYLDIDSVRFGLRAWIEDLAVAPDSRSAGIGAALMRAAREWGRERGATHIELDSGIRRRDAHRFYERLGPDWVSMQYAWLL